MQHFLVGTMELSPLQNMNPEARSVTGPMFIRGCPLFGHFYTVYTPILAYLVARSIMFRLIKVEAGNILGFWIGTERTERSRTNWIRRLSNLIQSAPFRFNKPNIRFILFRSIPICKNSFRSVSAKYRLCSVTFPNSVSFVMNPYRSVSSNYQVCSVLFRSFHFLWIRSVAFLKIG